MSQTVAEMLVNSILDNGIDTLYCLPGVQLDPFFDACYDRVDRLRIVHARHEQAAAYMAMGAQLSTGRPQSYCVVPGVGFLNSSAALATAYSVNSSVLAIVAQISSDAIGKGYGQLHEIPDQFAILEQLTKCSLGIRAPADAERVLKNLWRQLKSGPPKPVGLEIPMDMWISRAGFSESLAVNGDPGPPVDGEAVSRAVKLMKEAKAPMIVVGGGALDSGELVTELSRMLSAPVVAFRMGKGVVSHEEPLRVDMPTAYSLWPKVDLLIGLGSRMQWQTQIWGTDDDMKVVHVNLDPRELGRIVEPDVGICADLADALPKLLEKLEGNETRRDDWVENVLEEKGRVKARMESVIGAQLEWLASIRAELPREGILVDEVTQMGYVGHIGFPVYAPRTYVSSGFQGTLGYGYATALGVADARRDVPVVNFCGDGGIMYTLNEMATAVHHRIPITTIVFADGHYGNVRGFQRDQYSGRYIATDLSNPDFVKYAESFDVQGLRATTPDELRERLREGMAHPGPTLIEVPVGEFNSPWGFIKVPRIRGL
ncbi:MAG: thiamine pyrophosphate-binding protein [Roseovarius sp.]|nr:thiamine pyrophosphate-binding protein [Roseovarius sp.]